MVPPTEFTHDANGTEWIQAQGSVDRVIWNARAVVREYLARKEREAMLVDLHARTTKLLNMYRSPTEDDDQEVVQGLFILSAVAGEIAREIDGQNV